VKHLLSEHSRRINEVAMVQLTYCSCLCFDLSKVNGRVT